ncbi:MAG: hypothetical protein ACLFR6_05570 [Salinarchaeum sp.]
MADDSIADRTRRALREQPFLHEALRAGVLNHRAAARTLDVTGDTDAIATALRRYGKGLSSESPPSVTVRMRRNVSIATDAADLGLLTVGSTTIQDDGAGDATALLLRGADARTLARATLRLTLEDIMPLAAGIAEDMAILAVQADAGTTALRAVESIS